MDPTETIYSLLTAISEGDADYVREHADALASWIERGGFIPAMDLRTDMYDQIVAVIQRTPRGANGDRG